MMIKRSALAALVLLVASCASSPPVDYYTLQAESGRGVADPAGAVILGIGPLEMPGYLDRPQLVTRAAGGKVFVDEYNRWAEPLSDVLPRVLTANVDQRLDSVVVVSFPFGARIRADYRLAGRITRFDTDQSGVAVLEVQWGVQDAEANIVLEPRRTRYTAQASSRDDAGALVAALNQTLTAFSVDVANQLRSLLK
jgi:uncharacterized lipoprotein YmbA